MAGPSCGPPTLTAHDAVSVGLDGIGVTIVPKGATKIGMLCADGVASAAFPPLLSVDDEDDVAMLCRHINNLFLSMEEEK